MAIRAFRMQLKPGCLVEYRRRHDTLWPELASLLRSAGISDYRIFVDPNTLSLFAILHSADDATLARLPAHPLMQRWWDSMAELMEVVPGNRPVEIPLEQVFHLP